MCEHKYVLEFFDEALQRWMASERKLFKRLVKDSTLVKYIVFFNETLEFYFIAVWLFKRKCLLDPLRCKS